MLLVKIVDCFVVVVFLVLLKVVLMVTLIVRWYLAFVLRLTHMNKLYDKRCL